MSKIEMRTRKDKAEKATKIYARLARNARAAGHRGAARIYSAQAADKRDEAFYYDRMAFDATRCY